MKEKSSVTLLKMKSLIRGLLKRRLFKYGNNMVRFVFYYYGRKKQISKYYPAPQFNTIIEPFAGSAAYSLRDDNWKKEVILIEKDKRIVAIWKWLINEATSESISKLPDLEVGEKTSDFFHIIHAVTKQAFYYKTIKVTPVLQRNWRCSKRYIEKNIHKIKHWKIIGEDYTKAPDIEATWFIDPPYKYESGMGYDCGSDSLDYGKLAEWALKRKGEIIFCEGHKADYLPFKPLITLTGVAGKRNEEKMFYKINNSNTLINSHKNKVLEDFLEIRMR